MYFVTFISIKNINSSSKGSSYFLLSWKLLNNSLIPSSQSA